MALSTTSPNVVTHVTSRAARPSNSILAWFYSIRVGIVLLVILIVASTAGTLYKELEEAQAVIYYSWWYKLLLVALAVNMSFATVRQVSTKVLHAFRPHFQHQTFFYEHNDPSTSFSYTGSTEEAARVLRAAGYRMATDGTAGCGRSGQWGLWGSVLAHIGLVVVLIGGFAASWLAKEGFVQLPEGHQTSTMKLRQAGSEPIDYPLGFVLELEDFATEKFPQTNMPAFYRSWIGAYEEGMPPRHELVEVNTSPKIGGWRLHQTSFQAIPQLPRFELALRHEDDETTTMLELSPGQTRPIPGQPGQEITFVSSSPLRWEISLNGMQVFASKTVGGAGEQLTLLARRFEPDFVMDQSRQITSRSNELNNPALQVTLLAGSRELTTQWLFGAERLKGMMHAGDGAYALDLRDVSGEPGAWRFTVAVDESASGLPVGVFTLGEGESMLVRAAAEAPAPGPNEEDSEGPWSVAMVRSVEGTMSVLTLSRNPVIPVIYGGCLLMLVGLVIGFFVVRRRVWFAINPNKGLIHIAAAYRLPGANFDARTRAAIDLLARRGAGAGA